MLLFEICLFLNIGQQYKSNKHKIIVTAWKDEFKLPDDLHTVSDIQ